MGTLLVGFAAFNTGNNPLYLLWGAMLGSIAVSGWLSEQAVRGLEVRRRSPRGVSAGDPLRVRYEVRNLKTLLPSYALEISDDPFPASAFLPRLPAGETTRTRWEIPSPPRGVYPLHSVTVSTAFPFGLFLKSRDLPLVGEIIVWPRTDRLVRDTSFSSGWLQTGTPLASSAPEPRGEYRGLRSYRPGDDPRDIHWRTTARMGQPVVRQYEKRGKDSIWLCLDRRGMPGNSAEAAAEMTASLAAIHARHGRRFGFHTQGTTIDPDAGPGHLERLLDALARIAFHPDAPGLTPPGSPQSCTLVTLNPEPDSRFAHTLSPRDGNGFLDFPHRGRVKHPMRFKGRVRAESNGDSARILP